MPLGSQLEKLSILDVHELFDYFENLLGKEYLKSIYKMSKNSGKPNFWYIYLENYKKWKRESNRINDIPRYPKILDFIRHIYTIKIYQEDWEEPNAKREVINRLKNTSKVESLLFEFYSGSNFLLQGLEVHWLPNIGQEKVADLKVIAKNNGQFLIECTYRKPSFARVLMNQELVDDLLNSAKKKLDGKYDYACPRLVVVKVPEEIDWSSEYIKGRIDITFTNWLHQKKLNSVNAILFMGNAPLRRILVGESALKQVAYEPEQITYIHRNPEAKYPMPPGIELASKL